MSSNVFSELHERLSRDLRDLLIDATRFAWNLNEARDGKRPRLDSSTCHFSILRLGYRLLHIAPLSGPRPTSYIENMVYLGLASFILTFLAGLDLRIPHMPLLYQLSRSAAHQAPQEAVHCEQEVLLWVLCIGRAAVFKDSDQGWILSRMAQITPVLRLYYWQDVDRVMAKFPWVNALHDQAGLSLWTGLTP